MDRVWGGRVASLLAPLLVAACSLALAEGEYAGGSPVAADASADGSSDGSPLDAPASTEASVDADAEITSLVARWRFDDGSGTTARDDGPGANKGTLSAGVSWGAGKIAGAAVFNGTNGWVTVNGHPSLAVGEMFTLTLWIEADALDNTSDPRFFAHGARFSMKLNGGHPQLSSAGDYFAASYVLPKFEWHHLAVSFDRGQIAMYVDGLATPSLANTYVVGKPLPVDSTGATVIGASDGFDSPFQGALDDVRLYGRALSEAEIKSIAASR